MEDDKKICTIFLRSKILLIFFYINASKIIEEKSVRNILFAIIRVLTRSISISFA